MGTKKKSCDCVKGEDCTTCRRPAKLRKEDLQKELAKLEEQDAKLRQKNEEIGKQRLELHAEMKRLREGKLRFTLIHRFGDHSPNGQDGCLWYDARKRLFVYSDHSGDKEVGHVDWPDQAESGVFWLTGASWIEAHMKSNDEPTPVIRFDVVSERDGKNYKIQVSYAVGMEIIAICAFPMPQSHTETPMARALGLLAADLRERGRAWRSLPSSVEARLRELQLPLYAPREK